MLTADTPLLPDVRNLFRVFERLFYFAGDALQWVEVFERLSYYVFEAMCHPKGVVLALGVLRSFLHGSQLQDAALRCEVAGSTRKTLARRLIVPPLTPG